MTLNTFSPGVNTSFSTELNENNGLLAKQLIISRLNHEKTGTAGIVDDEGFVGMLVEDQTTAGYVDTGATTCYYDEIGLVAFCDVLDLFDDASINANIWSTAADASTGSGDSASVTEASGRLRVLATDVGSAPDNLTARAISNGASGLNIDGADAEIIIGYSYSVATNRTGGTGGDYARVKIQLSNGTTHVDLITHSASNSSDSGSKQVRMTFDDSADEIFVSTDGGAFGSAIDVSTVTGAKYIRFLVEFNTTNSGDTATAQLDVHGVGYRKHGASAGDAVFESAAQTIESASSGVVWAELSPTASPTAVISCDGGSTYGTDDVWAALGDAGTAGTSFQTKITVAKPTTIDPSTTNIPVLKKWGALVD